MPHEVMLIAPTCPRRTAHEHCMSGVFFMAHAMALMMALVMALVMMWLLPATVDRREQWNSLRGGIA